MEPKIEPTLLFQAEFPFGQTRRGKAMTMEAITCRGKAWKQTLVHIEVKQRHQWPLGHKLAALPLHGSKKDRVIIEF